MIEQHIFGNTPDRIEEIITHISYLNTQARPGEVFDHHETLMHAWRRRLRVATAVCVFTLMAGYGAKLLAETTNLDPTDIREFEGYGQYYFLGPEIVFANDQDRNLHVEVHHDFYPPLQVSPDQKKLLVPTRERTAFAIVDVDTQQDLAVISGKNPTWSPNGTEIVYAGGEDEEHTFIYLTDQTGQNTTQLTFGKGGHGHDYPRFSFDGKKVVFVARGVAPHGYWGPFVVDLEHPEIPPWRCQNPFYSAGGYSSPQDAWIRSFFTSATEPPLEAVCAFYSDGQLAEK